MVIFSLPLVNMTLTTKCMDNEYEYFNSGLILLTIKILKGLFHVFCIRSDLWALYSADVSSGLEYFKNVSSLHQHVEVIAKSQY